jgi:hypothetical protein
LDFHRKSEFSQDWLVIRRALAFAVFAALAPTLTAQDPPAFEGAVIKPSPPQPATQTNAGLRITERQARFTNLDLGDGASFLIANNRIEFRKATFAQLAGAIERFVDRPVIDQSRREGASTSRLTCCRMTSRRL